MAGSAKVPGQTNTSPIVLATSRSKARLDPSTGVLPLSSPEHERILKAAMNRMVTSPAPHNGGQTEQSCVDLGDSTRLALMITPKGRGPIREQVLEVVECLAAGLARHQSPLRVTVQTVFLRNPGDQAVCEEVFAEFFGQDFPVTNYVQQAPCCGAALALEAWSIGGPDVQIERFGKNTLAVKYDSVRWLYCAGIVAPREGGIYKRTGLALRGIQEQLRSLGSDYSHVVRTWFYLGGITDAEGQTQRYMELNRARTDFYRNVPFLAKLNPRLPLNDAAAKADEVVYPASTGIGMNGEDLVFSCVALDTSRKDLLLLPLENPQQTPAYSYHPKYSPKSPKFSRAMALKIGSYITTWVSGTASIVDSESRHPGDIEKQTHQTIDNIEKLIAAENFKRHGVSGAGATVEDLAKVRVYIKSAEDFEKCRAVCVQRFGSVPAIYAVADVCRPELLVEIEGVAFSRCTAH